METKRKNLTVCIDWLSMVLEDMDAKTLINIYLEMELPLFDKENRGIRFKEYDTKYTYGNIIVYTIEHQEDREECYLLLSGEGCRQLEQHLERQNQTWQTFFLELFQNGDPIRLTRIDLAIDDRNEKPYFTVEQLHKKCLVGQFKSVSQTFQYFEKDFQEDTAKTLRIGSKKANIMYRMYDKDKEQAEKKQIPLATIGSWKRFEVQLRNGYATEMGRLISDKNQALGALAFSFLKGNLQFLTADGKVSRFWERYLGKVASLQLKAPREPTLLITSQYWLETGGALGMIKGFELLKKYDALGELTSIDNLIKKVPISKGFARKMITHVSNLGQYDLVEKIQAETKKAEF